MWGKEIRFKQKMLINKHAEIWLIFTMAQHPPVSQGFLIFEELRSHSETQHSVGLLRTSDQPDAETCT